MQNTVPTTLHRYCPTEEVPIRFRQAIARRLEQSRQALDPMDTSGPGHLAAVSAFLDFLGVRGPSTTDPRIRTLWKIASNMGTLDDQDQLTPSQSQIVARLGDMSRKAPPQETTFNEMIMAAVEDYAEFMAEKVGKAQLERDEADQRAAENGPTATRLKELEVQLQEARDVIDGLNGDLDEARGQISYFRDRGIEEAAQAEPPVPSSDKPKKKPRRTAIEGEDGLYITDSGKLQIGYIDAESKQRWKTLGNPDDAAEVAAARELRESLSGEPFEPLMADAKEAVAA
jgi:hypothetical protein